MLYVETGVQVSQFLASEISRAYADLRDVYIYRTSDPAIRPFQAIHSFYEIDEIISIYCNKVFQAENHENYKKFSIFIPQIDFDESVQERFFSLLSPLKWIRGDVYIGLSKTPYLHLLDRAECVKVECGNHRIVYDFVQDYLTPKVINERIYAMLKEDARHASK